MPREGQLLRPCRLLAERGRDLPLGAAAKPRPRSYSASLISPPLPAVVTEHDAEYLPTQVHTEVDHAWQVASQDLTCSLLASFSATLPST